MGVCVNFLGIPLIEDRECAESRRRARNRRKQIEEDSDVAKRESKDDRREANVYNRNAQQLGSSIARNYGTDDDPNFGELLSGTILGVQAQGDATLSSLFGGEGGTIAAGLATGGIGALPGLLGAALGGDAVAQQTVAPLLLLAAGLGLAYVATRE